MKKSLLWLLILVISLSMVLTFSVVGCKAAEEEEAAAEEEVEEVASTEEEAEETEEEAAPEKVTITYWQSGSEAYQDAYESIADQFMAENPNIEVKIYLQPSAGYEQKVMAAFIAGEEPDIINSAHDYAIEIEQRYAAWLNLDDYGVRDWEEVKLMDPNILEVLTYNEKFYGVQISDQVLALFLRKSWMENVGWEKDYPYLESWDDLIELGKKFTFDDPDQNGADDTWGYEMFGSLSRNYALVQFEYVLNAAGEELITQDGKLNINTEAGIAALTFMQNAVHKHKIAPSDTASFTHVEFYRDVPAGIVGIGRLGSWNVAKWVEALNGDFVALPFPPIVEGAESYASTIYRVLLVSKNSKHPEEALKFVKYQLGKSAQTELYTTIGYSYRPDLDYENICATEQDLFFRVNMTPDKVNRIYVVTEPWWTYDAKLALAEYIQLALIDPNVDPAEVLAAAEVDINERFAPKE